MRNDLYDSASDHPPMIGEFVALVRYRSLLRLLVVYSIRARHKRSALGVLWTLLGPLLATAVMVLVFTGLFRGRTHNYALFILTGLVFWNFFAQSTLMAMQSLGG